MRDQGQVDPDSKLVPAGQTADEVANCLSDPDRLAADTSGSSPLVPAGQLASPGERPLRIAQPQISFMRQ